MIRLLTLSHRYHDGQHDVWALRDVNLAIQRGQTVSCIGRSGSGKSTLLHLVAGLEPPTTGSIVVDGIDLGTLDDDQRTLFRLKHVGLVFQFFHLVPGLAAVENVMFPAELAGQSRRVARSRARDLLESVNLLDRADAFPDQLSGGEQQRVAIARSLILEPPLLLADEPTGNLDASTGERIADLLFDLARHRGLTLVIATHSPDLARRTERIVELSGGQIVSDSRAP